MELNVGSKRALSSNFLLGGESEQRSNRPSQHNIDAIDKMLEQLSIHNYPTTQEQYHLDDTYVIRDHPLDETLSVMKPISIHDNQILTWMRNTNPKYIVTFPKRQVNNTIPWKIKTHPTQPSTNIMVPNIITDSKLETWLAGPKSHNVIAWSTESKKRPRHLDDFLHRTPKHSRISRFAI